MTTRHVWRRPGQEASKLPPVQIGEAWYDADTCAEIQRLIDEHDARDDGLTEDRYFVLENGQTPHELLDSTGSPIRRLSSSSAWNGMNWQHHLACPAGKN